MLLKYFLNFICKIAFDDLRVIEIHLHLEVGLGHLFDNRVRIRLRIQEVAWNVARIDRLDQQRALRLGKLARGESEILHVHRAVRASVAARRNDPTHRVQCWRAGEVRIFERSCKRCPKLTLAPRKGCQAALTGGKIPGPKIQPAILQAGVIEPFRNVARRVIVWKQQLDCLEAVACSSGKPLLETAIR